MLDPLPFSRGIIIEERNNVTGSVLNTGVPCPGQSLALGVCDHFRVGKFGLGSLKQLAVVVDHQDGLKRLDRLLCHRLDGSTQQLPSIHGVGADNDGQSGSRGR